MITQDKGTEYKERSHFYGLSVEEKPRDCGNGSVFHEIDTGRDCEFDKEHETWIRHGEEFVVKSTDTKPTGVREGSLLVESDTGHKFLFTKDQVWEQLD